MVVEFDYGYSIRYILYNQNIPSTYGHSQLKTGHPVRSAIHKQLNGRLVLRWVTTWESLLLYVLLLSLFLFHSARVQRLFIAADQSLSTNSTQS